MQNRRIVITGIGLAAPNGANIQEYREKLINGISEIQEIELRYFGKAPAGDMFISGNTLSKEERKQERHPGRLPWSVLRQ